MNFLDRYLNSTTMYRLVLWYLAALLACAFLLSALGILRYDALLLLLGAAFILAVSTAFNAAFAKFFDAPVNAESALITGLILVFLVTPLHSLADAAFWKTAFLASAIAIASKFIVAANKKHLFNPAAFGAAATLILFGLPASWWIGTAAMFLPVLLGGLVLARKLNRADLLLAFFGAALAFIFIPRLIMGGDPDLVLWLTAKKIFLDTPILFFGFVMLTEPLTTPPGRALRILYGIFVGILYVPQFHIGALYLSPELALLVGNVFSYAVSFKRKLVLRLEEKIRITPDVYDFVFAGGDRLPFAAGQYLEWTLGGVRSDSRGNRRYFTVASAPAEDRIRLGVKFHPSPSAFKERLLALRPGETIAASGLDGEFVLPENPEEKLAFIAGGIGSTPFRSMAMHLLGKNEKRDIVFAYANSAAENIAYKDVFDRAEAIGMKTLHVISGEGRIDRKFIEANIPDFPERTFYVSGPSAMVRSVKKILLGLGVGRRRIITDFFPGFV